MNNIFLTNPIGKIIADLKEKKITYIDLYNSIESAYSKHEKQTHCWTNFDLKRLKNIMTNLDTLEVSPNYLLPGIPFGVKDIFNTKEFPTEMGSTLWKDFTPGNNARSVDSYTDEGAIIAGKTVTAEFAVHALNETKNPHNVAKTPGTSSSGSAAAVATGMVPFALATQTAGSIIRPASFCGVWGMKPSFGLIPRTAILKTTDSLDTIGFITTHGKNLKLLLDVVRVKGHNYPYVHKYVDPDADIIIDRHRNFKIGFVKTHTWNKAEKYVQDALTSFVTKLDSQANFSVSEISWPAHLSDCHSVHSTIYDKSLSYYFKNEKLSPDKMSPIMLKLIEAGEKIDTNKFKTALASQEKFGSEISGMFSDYDAIISIATGSSAPDRNVEELPDPSLIWTLAHCPSVNVPLFRCPAKMPFGLQITGSKWSDYRILRCIDAMLENELIPQGSLSLL